MKLHRLCLTLAALFTAAGAYAADPKLAIVYDAGGKFDKSFNQSASEGAERFKKETKISYLEVQVGSDTQTEQVLRNLARKNVDLVAAIGFAQAQAVQTVAKEFPKVKFVLIDGVANGDNISSVLFKEQEGSYLVGVAAAMASKSKKVGFVGGMDIPLIRAFACGYAQGAKAIDAKIEVTQNMVGTTPTAWNDPAKGGELARAQFERGVDVVFAAAGGSGMGSLQAAKEKGKLAIGNVINTQDKYPDTVVASALWNMEPTIDLAIKKVKGNSFGAEDYGVYSTMKHKGSELAPLGTFEKKVPAELIGKVKAKEKAIADSKFVVKVIETEPKSSM